MQLDLARRALMIFLTSTSVIGQGTLFEIKAFFQLQPNKNFCKLYDKRSRNFDTYAHFYFILTRGSWVFVSLYLENILRMNSKVKNTLKMFTFSIGYRSQLMARKYFLLFLLLTASIQFGQNLMI